MFEGLLQPMHLLVILVIGLIVLGPKKLPELGAGLGKGIREFKKAISVEPEKFTLENKTVNPIKAEEVKTGRSPQPEPDRKPA
jgi:sec-independent protein translocase protein TatA